MGLVGTVAPKFKTAAIINGGESVDNFSLDQYTDKNYVVLFFYQRILLLFVLQSFMLFKKS